MDVDRSACIIAHGGRVIGVPIVMSRNAFQHAGLMYHNAINELLNNVCCGFVLLPCQKYKKLPEMYDLSDGNHVVSASW